MIWLGNVDAPKSVYPNISFEIKWREWHLVWPFKEYKFFSRIKKDGVIISEHHYTVNSKWFWGSKEHIIIELGLINNSEYKIEVGND